MGRSKFPGKPSKLATKKRVSVLVVAPTTEDNSSSPDHINSSSCKSSGLLSTTAAPGCIDKVQSGSANKCISDVTGGGAIASSSVANSSVNIKVVANNGAPKQCPCQNVKSAASERCAKCAINSSVVVLGGNASPPDSKEYCSAAAASRGENLISSHHFHNGDKAQVTSI